MASAGAQDDKVVFKYVYIPADHTESLEERTFKCDQSDDVMGFLNMAKAHFTAASPAQSQAEQQQLQKAFRANLGAKAAGVSDEMLNMLAGHQLVEPIALLANAPETGFVGVYMYCDDQATLKHLPINQRATAIAAAAGQALEVSGDVFIGRYFDNEDDFKRMDFTLSDLNSSAPWIQEAQQQILRRSQRSSNTQALMHNLQQQHTDSKQAAAAAAATAAGGGSSAAKQQSPSEVEKVKGNEAYRKRDYQAALGHYTAALKLDPSNTAARNNRAQAYLALHMHQQAAADTAAVLEAEPQNVKALLRRAAAREGLSQCQEAAADCRRALELEPFNVEAKQRLAKLQEQLGAGGDQQQQQEHEGQPGEQQPQEQHL